ncbi:MAG: hypothetical protein ABR981_05620 [Candidatus Micrarchaeaceae archaeon]
MKTILVDAVDAFIINVNGTYKVFKAMYDLLESFPNRKILLTSANDEGFKKYDLDKVPYVVFTLKHDPEKTNPQYYEILLRHLNLGRNDVIYFEHNPDAVKSAEKVGITSYYYDSEKADLRMLKKFLSDNL